MNNIDFTSRESEGETIFYDANQIYMAENRIPAW